MTTYIFLILAAICAGIYFFSKRKSMPTNRYHSKKKSVEPVITAQPVQQKLPLEEYESDEALGIRVLEKKSAKFSPTPTSTHQACIVVLYLMAPENEPYTGYELLQALLSAGLRFGKHNIFHRHEEKDGQGDILFHCANAVSPGTFDLTKMGSFSCPGLSLFFSASDVPDAVAALDCLLETIDQLVDDLGGRVLDEKRQLLSKDRVMQYRQQLRAFENSKNTADLFA